jgi:hypothetical protein
MARIVAFASLSVGATAFTQMGTPPLATSGPAQSMTQQENPNRAANMRCGKDSTGAAFGVAATLSLMAAASHSRRAVRIARKGVITYNSEGQARFAQARPAELQDAKVPRVLQSQTASMAAVFDPSKELGAMEPLGYWDPASLMKDSKTGEWLDEATFRKYRTAELKHGRVAMIAGIGLLAGTFAKWPGFEDVPSGWAALSTSQGGGGLGIIVLIAGLIELDFWVQDESKEPGDFSDVTKGWIDPYSQDTYLFGSSELQIYPYLDELRAKELNNGRLAMSAVITCLLVEYLTGNGPEDQVSNLPTTIFNIPGSLVNSVNSSVGSEFWVFALICLMIYEQRTGEFSKNGYCWTEGQIGDRLTADQIGVSSPKMLTE